MLELELPVQLVSAANLREHWSARRRRVKAHRDGAALLVRMALRRVGAPPPPYLVTLTRVIGPRGRELDDDNLRSALKAVRDGIAEALGVDDGDRSAVVWNYAPEERGRWGARIRIEGGASPPPPELTSGPRSTT
ncbi:MAG TPA: hypothetical protein VFP50_15565 [Anaeromyxobacteraceae bacterium]|nr:hypothetical protein [Anaeromyxobacteraceae bacterium]